MLKINRNTSNLGKHTKHKSVAGAKFWLSPKEQYAKHHFTARDSVLYHCCDTTHACVHTKTHTHSHTLLIIGRPQSIAGSNLLPAIPLLFMTETHLIYYRQITVVKTYLSSLYCILHAYLYLPSMLKSLSYIFKYLPDGYEKHMRS